MDERINGPYKPVRLRSSCYRIPDGHIVPHAPRHQPPPATAEEILAEGEPAPPVTFTERWWAVALVCIVVALMVVGILW